jgi:hypothetical protein
VQEAGDEPNRATMVQFPRMLLHTCEAISEERTKLESWRKTFGSVQDDQHNCIEYRERFQYL